MYCLVLAIFFMSGCGANGSEKIQTRANATVKDGITRLYKRKEIYNNLDEVLNSNMPDTVHDFDEKTHDTERRTKVIADGVTKMKGIKRASVVISGNTAIVGIEVEGDLTDASLIKYKTDVDKKVKSIDKAINHVSVTASLELVGQINDIADSAASDSGTSNSAADKKSADKPHVDGHTEEIITKLTPVF